MARRKIVAGNWKMNKTPSEAKALVEMLAPLVKNDDVDVVYCVPAVDIVPVVEAVKGSNVAVGAENISDKDSGAFTGEISGAMLKDAGVKYVIIGHSERRDYYKEDDAFLNRKVLKAFEYGLIPILCCGESLEQREANVTIDWIRLQLKSDLILSGLSAQARSLPLSRLRKSAMRSASSSLRSMMLTQLRRSAFSTAALSTALPLPSCSHSPTSTAASSAALP